MWKTLCLVLSLLATSASAQISMTVQLPPEGILLKSQLWNIMLVSAGSGQTTVRIAMRLTDPESNEQLLSGISRSIILGKGARQLRLEDVMPVAYEYLSPLVDRNPAGTLPAGKYLACYQLIVENGKNKLQPQEQCVPFVIAPVSPPLLNTPANGAVSETPLPQFTWLPPAPIQLFNDLNYEMLLTEVQEGQSAEEAVRVNMPVYRAPRLKTPYVNYPSGGSRLDTTKRYAWTVIARNGKQFAAQTEVWTFRVRSRVHAVAYNGDAYLALKKEMDGTMAAAGKELHCFYNNETGEGNVAYEIISLDEGNRIVQKGKVSLAPGPNQLNVRLQRKVRTGNHYLFRFRNNRNESWHIKFTPVDK